MDVLGPDTTTEEAVLPGREEGQEARQPRLVRLVTQNMNIHHFVHHSFPNREARIQGLVAQVGAYDVVLLQELFKFHLPFGASTGGSWRDFVARATSPQHHHQASHDPPSWFQQDTGLMILSKSPIASAKTIFFRSRSRAEMVSLKGALLVKLNMAEQSTDGGSQSTLIVVTAHLDAHSLDVRLAQLQQVMDELVFPELEADEDARIVLGGDLNIDSRHQAGAWDAARRILAPLESAMYREGVRPDADNDGGLYPVTHDRWDVCLDHLFVSHNVEVERGSLRIEKWTAIGAAGTTQQQGLVSDHYGVSLTLVL